MDVTTESPSAGTSPQTEKLSVLSWSGLLSDEAHRVVRGRGDPVRRAVRCTDATLAVDREVLRGGAPSGSSSLDTNARSSTWNRAAAATAAVGSGWIRAVPRPGSCRSARRRRPDQCCCVHPVSVNATTVAATIVVPVPRMSSPSGGRTVAVVARPALRHGSTRLRWRVRGQRSSDTGAAGDPVLLVAPDPRGGGAPHAVGSAPRRGGRRRPRRWCRGRGRRDPRLTADRGGLRRP